MFNLKINNLNKFYAHTSNSKKPELLEEHLDKTMDYFELLEKEYDIKNKFYRSFKEIRLIKTNKTFKLSKSDIDTLYMLFREAIRLHDIGKINPTFQVNKMDNCDFKGLPKKSYSDTKHSQYSMLIYINECYKYIKSIETENKLFLKYMILIFGNSIYSHHMSLMDLIDVYEKSKLETLFKNINDNNALDYYDEDIIINEKIHIVIEKISKYSFNRYIPLIWGRLLSSLLIVSDFIATGSYYKKSNNDFEINNIKNIGDLLNEYKNTNIYKGIKEFEKDKDFFKKKGLPLINELRSEIALESWTSLEKEKFNYNLFNLNSPTGSGKTFNSIGCSLELMTGCDLMQKLIYVFPINAISSQTTAIIRDTFKSYEIAEVNSITPLNERYFKDGSINYDTTLLDRQLLNYPIVSTSNITLFNLLFNNERENLMGLCGLFNSVIILDEIQNYNNSIWQEMIEFFNEYSKIMNIKILIMSATLPDLDRLLLSKERKIGDLIHNPKKYYENPIFKDRVSINRDLLKEDVNYLKILTTMNQAINKRNKLYPNKKSIVLVEFITRRSSMEFYNMAKLNYKPEDNVEVYQLDSYDNSIKRGEVIKKIQNFNNKKDLILISTQIIEAGVDIDVDIGFKDISFPDLDEQFLGRINRSMKKENCEAYFFNLDNESKIYKEDYRKGFTIAKDNFFKCLIEKNFNILYNAVLDIIKSENKKGLINYIQQYDSKLLLHCHSYISNTMKLINDNTFSVFISGDYEINGYKASDVWNEYIKILESDYKYTKKRVELIKHNSKMQLFMFNIYGKELAGEVPIGGIFNVPAVDGLIVDDKLNLEYFKSIYTIK